MADNYLLEHLPGLTLADIDSMDVHRLSRALQVRRMQAIEEKRTMHLSDKLSQDAITPDEWRIIRYHDAIVSASDG